MYTSASISESDFLYSRLIKPLWKPFNIIKNGNEVSNQTKKKRTPTKRKTIAGSHSSSRVQWHKRMNVAVGHDKWRRETLLAYCICTTQLNTDLLLFLHRYRRLCKLIEKCEKRWEVPLVINRCQQIRLKRHTKKCCLHVLFALRSFLFFCLPFCVRFDSSNSSYPFQFVADILFLDLTFSLYNIIQSVVRYVFFLHLYTNANVNAKNVERQFRKLFTWMWTISKPLPLLNCLLIYNISFGGNVPHFMNYPRTDGSPPQKKKTRYAHPMLSAYFLGRCKLWNENNTKVFSVLFIGGNLYNMMLSVMMTFFYA